MTSYFDEFIKEGCKWITHYRKKIMKKAYIILPFFTLICPLFGLISYAESKDMEEFWMATFAAFILIVLPACSITLFLFSRTTRSKRFIKNAKKAVKRLNMDEREKEFFAKEILSALSNPENVLDYFIKDPTGRSYVFGRFIVTPNYACHWGDYPFINIIRLSDVAEVHASEREVERTVRQSQSTTYYTYTVYDILFFYKESRKDKPKEKDLPDGSMSFFTEELREQVFAMLQRQDS